jgi:plasmid replication initiation protein
MICGIDEDSGKNYENLKKAVKTLREKCMWIKDGNTEFLFAWLEYAIIEHNNGTIKIKISDFMKPYLLQLKEHFTQYSLYYVLTMRSKYSLRLYELLKSYAYKRGCEFDLDEFKILMDAQNHYTRHSDFEKNVVDIAVNEINGFSDITVVYAFEKTGRKYTKIKFGIMQKKDFDERMQVLKKIDNRLHQRVRGK